MLSIIRESQKVLLFTFHVVISVASLRSFPLDSAPGAMRVFLDSRGRCVGHPTQEQEVVVFLPGSCYLEQVKQSRLASKALSPKRKAYLAIAKYTTW